MQIELTRNALIVRAVSDERGSLLEIDVTGAFSVAANACTVDQLRVIVPMRQVTVLSEDPSFAVTYNQNHKNDTNGDKDKDNNNNNDNSDDDDDDDGNDDDEDGEGGEQLLHLLLSVASTTHRDVIVVCLRTFAQCKSANSTDIKYDTTQIYIHTHNCVCFGLNNA